jgi:hypothetical protein
LKPVFLWKVNKWKPNIAFSILYRISLCNL